LAILQPLASDPGADSRVRQNLAVALALAGDEAQARRVLSADMPQETIASALAGYVALKVSAK
jgi:Flp pilus assembly protein TadD